MDAKRLEEKVEKPTMPPLSLGEVATDHPTMTIPFTAEINGRHCLGTGISLVNATVAGLLDPALNGQERIARLSFSFQGFIVVLTVECRIKMIGDAGGKAALIFLDPSGDHLPQLRHILNSWIAGDVVSIGPILGVSIGQDRQKTGGKAQAASGPGLLARAFGTLTMLAAAAGLAVAVLMLTYVRGYLITLPVPARIAAEGQVLTALAAGQIDYVNSEAAAGEVAFTLRAEGGQVLSVTMPCDCVGSLDGLASGSTVQAGDPVMIVHAPDAPLAARVSVPSEMLFDLAKAESALLTLPDGRQVAARLVLPLPTPAATKGDLVPVTFAADAQDLSADLSGSLAEVTLSRKIPTLLEPARALYNALGG
jgi:mannuronan synthase